MKRRVLGKTVSFHALFIKKKHTTTPKRCRFEWHHHLLPLDTQRTGEEDLFFLLCFSPTSLPPMTLKRRRPRTPTCLSFPRVGRAVEGRQHSGRPSHASPLFFYKYRGDEEERDRKKNRTEKKKKEPREREREQRRGKREKKRKDERKRKEKERKTDSGGRRKHRGRRRRNRRPPCLRLQQPPASPPLQVSPPPLLFCLHFFPRHARRAQCTSAGGEKLVTVLMHSKQLRWVGPRPTHVVGPGSAQPMYLGLPGPFQKKKSNQILVVNFTIFLRSFFYVILINIGLYFIPKNTNPVLKIPSLRQNFQKYRKTLKKEKKCFCAYGQVSQS